MAFFGKGKPNIQTLARREDVEGLVEAASFQELMPGRDGETIDVGAPVREEAILELGALGLEAGNGTVAKALADPSDRVRVAAVRVLYARKKTAPLAEAIGWLPADGGHSRRLALQALAELRRHDSARMLAAALVRARGDDPIREGEAVLLETLLKSEDGWESRSGVFEELLSALADEREVVGDRAEELLAELSPASIERVIAELKGGAAPHRAASVLARIRDRRTLDPLVEALEHRDPRVRAQSAAALGELQDPAAVDPLLRATRDSDYAVRSQAGRALDRLGTVAVVIGVAALLRPMIQDTVTATLEERQARAESAPALPGSEEPYRDLTEAAPLHRLVRPVEGLENEPAGRDTSTT
jgi:HEAT repeat protein